jgi:hypothetical protein
MVACLLLAGCVRTGTATPPAQTPGTAQGSLGPTQPPSLTTPPTEISNWEANRRAGKLLLDCVEYVKLASFLGDAEAKEIMGEVNNDLYVLRSKCGQMSFDEPARLERFQRSLASLRETLNSDGSP